jgi:hypothetical protein
VPGTYGDIIIADPKEERAVELARVWNERGIWAEGRKEPCEKAIERVDADAVLLAIDTISPMAKILKKSPLPAQWQLLCRGLGENGPVIGMSGSIHNGASEERSSSMKLIKELGSFIEPQSSLEIRRNPLNADFLHAIRARVSGHSASRLMVLEKEPKDIDGGPLNLFWGPTYHPLMVQEKPVKARWRELKEQAVNAEMPPYLRNAPRFAVAIVGNKNIDLFVVEEVRGRRSIRFHMPLVHALPSPADSADSRTNGAAVATGLGAALFASMLSAVVTD